MFPAAAAFSNFLSLGTILVQPDISCASDQPGKAVCAARTLNGQRVVDRYDGTVWSGWQTLPGAVSSGPGCAAVGSGKIICANRSNTGKFTAVTFNGTTWSAAVDLGGAITSAPSCAAYNVTSVMCVGRSGNGALQWLTTDGTTGSTPALLAATSIFAPRCASDNPAVTTKNVVCTYINLDSKIYTRRFNGTSFTGAVNLDGRASTEFPCTDLGTGVVGKVLCLGSSNDSGLYANLYNGGAFTVAQWSGFGNTGGNTNYAPSCASYAANAVICGAVGNIDSAFYVNDYSGGGFHGWTLLGSNSLASPSCFTLQAGKVMCAFVTVAGKANSTVGP